MAKASPDSRDPSNSGGGFALKTDGRGTGCDSGLRFKCQDTIAEEQDFLAERNDLVLDPRIDVSLNPDSPSLGLLLLLRDLDMLNVRVEELFTGCEGCGYRLVVSWWMELGVTYREGGGDPELFPRFDLL